MKQTCVIYRIGDKIHWTILVMIILLSISFVTWIQGVGEGIFSHVHAYELDTALGKEIENRSRELLKKKEETLGPKHPDTLFNKFILATSYTLQGRYNEAETLFIEVLRVQEEVLGTKHRHPLWTKEFIARLYRDQGRYTEAEALYKEVLAAREEVLGPKHPDTLCSLTDYSVCLIVLKKEKMALSLLQTLEERLLSRTSYVLYTSLKERVKRDFLLSTTYLQNIAFSFAFSSEDPEVKRFAANVLLRWKQVLFEEEAFMAHLVQISSDNEIKALSKRIIDLRSNLSVIVNRKSDGGESKEIGKVLEELETEELKLAGLCKEYKEHLAVKDINIENVRSCLPKDSVLIDFKTFEPIDFKTLQLGQPHLAALVISQGRIERIHGEAPSFIRSCPGRGKQGDERGGGAGW